MPSEGESEHAVRILDYLITHTVLADCEWVVRFIRSQICHNFVTTVTLNQRRDR